MGGDKSVRAPPPEGKHSNLGCLRAWDSVRWGLEGRGSGGEMRDNLEGRMCLVGWARGTRGAAPWALEKPRVGSGAGF